MLLAVELGLHKSYILVGSRLSRGGWESYIHQVVDLHAKGVFLPRDNGQVVK